MHIMRADLGSLIQATQKLPALLFLSSGSPTRWLSFHYLFFSYLSVKHSYLNWNISCYTKTGTLRSVCTIIVYLDSILLQSIDVVLSFILSLVIQNRATIVFWFPRDQRQQKYSSVCQKNNYCFCSLWLGKQLFGNFTVYIKHYLFLGLYCILKMRIILGTVKSLNFFFIYWFHISIQLGNQNFQKNVLQNQTLVNWTHSSASLAPFQQCICVIAYEKLHWVVCMARFSISDMKADLLCTSLYKMVLYTALIFLNYYSS